ncbi:MAG TPA: DUF6236 family protein [Actinophytocola sp.]|uniref:DUF6236 family protein n=1 Tax=Actinophytocola sp. TaxID=1872138 RepID=UPI002E0823CB|nr:DUF6236 family protein [Actinophytocola sp.]
MHFQDDNWLKLALLTWDKVFRIRPRDVDNRDTEVVRQVCAETDLVEEMAPSSSDLEHVSAEFLEILGADRQHLVELYHIEHGGGSWSDLADSQKRGARSTYYPADGNHNTGSPSFSRELFWIYCGSGGSRMADQLRSLLIDVELGTPEPGGQPWIGVRPMLGSIYMATLADVIAKSNNNLMSPVTDDLAIHHAVGASDRIAELLFDGRSRNGALNDPESAYVHLAINAVLEPTRLSDIPVSRLVQFRQRYRAELIDFQRHVAGLAAELEAVAAIENLDVARAHLQALYDRTTRRQLDELRQALRGMGIESLAGALALKVDLGPTLGALMASAVAVGGNLLLGGTAVALAVVPYAAGKAKVRRNLRNESAVSYLLAADRKLKGGSLLRAFG